ncbi:MAG: BamA/TamA family outer membrane protein, partial [Planctomycetota bacterium]
DPINHREPDYRLKPVPDQPGMLDVEYIVDEGRVVDFQVAGGVDSNSGAFGLISLSMRNFDIADWPDSFWGMFGEIYRKEAFHGAGQQLDVQVSPGSEINFWRVRFQEPDIFRSHFKQVSLDLEAGQRERLFRPYDEERTTAKVRFGYEPIPDFRMFFGYLDSRVEVDDLDDPPFPQQLFDQQGEADLNALSLDFSYRQLDSAINPRKGVTVNFNNAWYADSFGSDFEFVKSSVAGDLYWPVGDPLADVRPSFHFSGGLGVASPQGDSDFVPYTERFFLGGFRTLRGFGFRGVGPNVGRTPIGGETYFNASLEYRIPVYTIAQPGTYKQVEMFRLIPFVDIGNLGQEDFQLDETETRVSAGIGFGLANPFPLTLNFGFPLREGDGDDRQVVSFNLAFR